MQHLSVDGREATFRQLLGAYGLPPHDDSRISENIYDIIKTLPEASTFMWLLERQPRLVTRLAEMPDGEITLFLPVNSAWTQIPAFAERVTEDDCYASAVLAMHVSKDYLDDGYLSSMTNVTTLYEPITSPAPQVFPIRLTPEGFIVGRNGRFIGGGFAGCNGLIYLIDQVILPSGSLLRSLYLRGNYSTLLRAIQTTGFHERLDFQPGGTLFAPSDRAFASLDPELLQFLTGTEEGRPYLVALLRLHFCPSNTFYTSFSWPQDSNALRRTSLATYNVYQGHRCEELPSALGAEEDPVRLTVSITRYMCLVTMAVNGALVEHQDIDGFDGVAHGIDELLLPGGTVRGQYPSPWGTLESSERVINKFKSAFQPYL